MLQHLGSLENTQEAKFARGALLRLFCALQTSRVLNVSTYSQ